MAVSKIPDAILRPIKLTPEETEMLIQEAERIISETLAASDLFIANDRYLSKGEWKHVKTKEHVQVYRTRKGKSRGLSPSCSESFSSPATTGCGNGHRSRSKAWGKGNGGPSSQRPVATSSCSDSSSGSSANCDSTTSSSDFTVEINRTKPVGLPLVIAAGTISGTVEDVAFGALAYNERLTRHRDAHIQEKYESVKVLATILRPTTQDPFQSLVVKWTCKNVRALSRMRDHVFIEANGIATDSNGNEVAYHLVHSIDSIPRIPGFKHLDIMRANLSMCYITRQFDQSSVEVFCRGFADPGGVSVESIASYVPTDLVLSVVHVVDCAYIKKLIWFTHKKRQCNPASNSSSQSPASHCTNCATSLTTFGNLIHTGTACRACRQEICGKCSVTKKVAVEASSTEMKTKRVTYCVHCVVEAKQASAAEAALTMMELFDPKWNGTQT